MPSIRRTKMGLLCRVTRCWFSAYCIVLSAAARRSSVQLAMLGGERSGSGRCQERVKTSRRSISDRSEDVVCLFTSESLLWGFLRAKTKHIGYGLLSRWWYAPGAGLSGYVEEAGLIKLQPECHWKSICVSFFLEYTER